MRGCWLLLVVGCAPQIDWPEGQPAQAPLEGKADSAGAADSADRACGVVLRDVSRPSNGMGGYQTEGAWWVWMADLDVATSLGATGALLYRAAGGDWASYDGLAVPGAPGGYQRYRFHLAANTAPQPGWSGTSIARARAELAPYAQLPGGGRLFDHNRNPGDLDNYGLTSDNHFALADDGACLDQAQPRAELELLAGFNTRQHGALVAGGHVSVHYDLGRLTTCRSTHNGYRFWSLEASIRFQPGGQTSTGTVVASNLGSDYPVPFEAEIPLGAQSAELWFHNYTPGECDAWDSNYGANYRVSVGTATAPVGWVGDFGSSFSRDCGHQPGVPEPAVIDEYVRERACSFIDADVWVPGGEDHPEWIFAQVEWHKEGQPAVTSWLDYAGRAGNNSRFRWNLPYELRNLSDWTNASYHLRFSTDGNAFTAGPEGTLERQ
jgi:Family of unknown function (DUF6209)